jgi:branched-chain amino acid transport system substrate-binding protein
VLASPAMRILRRTLICGLFTEALGSFIGCKKPAPEGGTTAGTATAASTEIVFGHFASMTGSTAHFGQDTDRGVRMAIEEANAKGGVLGKKIKLVTLDDRGDSAEAANAVSRLIDVEKVSALLGEVSSSLSLAGGRVAQRRKIPMISPTSTNPKVTEVGDYIFRVCFIDPFQGKVMATFARQNLKFDKVAILKDVKNDYSIGLADAFRKSFTEMGGKIVAEQSYSQGDTDFSAQVTAVRGTGAQALFVPGYYSEVGSIARTADRLGLKVPLLGGDGWDSPDLFKIGGDAINGSYFSDHFAPDVATDKAKAFVANFTTKYGQAPTGLGALGYEAALVLIDAVARAGKTDPTAIRDAIATTKDFEGVTGKITLDAQRNAQKSAVVLKVVDGKAKFEASIAP